jgi:hypothetical protein
VTGVGGSDADISTYGTKEEHHDSIGKSWICFDSPYGACNWLHVANGQYGRGEAAIRPEYEV